MPAAGGVLAPMLGFAAAVMAMACAAVAAQPPGPLRLHFDIPAQPLVEALVRYSDTTGQAVLVDVDLTSGLRSRTLRGEFAPAEALQALLGDAPLAVRRASAHAFTLVPRPPGAAGMPGQRPRRLRDTPYAAAVQRAVRQALCAAAGIQPGAYRMLAQLWIDASGSVERVRLVQASGAPGLDEKLRAALLASAPGPVPAGMPQPLTVLLQPRPDQARECLALAGAGRHG